MTRTDARSPVKVVVAAGMLLALSAAVVWWLLPAEHSPLGLQQRQAVVVLPHEADAVIEKASAGPAETGVVYAVSGNGLITPANSAVPLLVVASEADIALEMAEEEWDAAVTALQVPLNDKSSREMAFKRFRNAFSHLPHDRYESALSFADNVIPDVNFAAIAELVFDKRLPPEIVNSAFSDALNRPDDIFVPIINRVAADVTHPNYVDAVRLRDIHRLSGSGRVK